MTRLRTRPTARPARRPAGPALSAAALLALSGLTAAAAPASASLTGPGVDAGQNITVFHDLDVVGVFGYGPVGSTVTVDVLRDGVRVGTAGGPTVGTPEAPASRSTTARSAPPSPVTAGPAPRPTSAPVTASSCARARATPTR